MYHYVYRQLLETTCKVANVLKDYGISRGDRVIIFLPAMPLAVASMLACARMGAVHWYNLEAKFNMSIAISLILSHSLSLSLSLSFSLSHSPLPSPPSPLLLSPGSVVFSDFDAEALKERVIGSKYSLKNLMLKIPLIINLQLLEYHRLTTHDYSISQERSMHRFGYPSII